MHFQFWLSRAAPFQASYSGSVKKVLVTSPLLTSLEPSRYGLAEALTMGVTNSFKKPGNLMSDLLRRTSEV